MTEETAKPIMGNVIDMPSEKPVGLPAPFEFRPTSLAEAMELAKIMATSSIVPKDYIDKPGNILVAIQWGMELGLKPLQAMQNIAIINGRPSIWGDAMLAIVRASPVCDYVREPEPTDEEGVCIVKRRGEPEVKRTFTRQDAAKAGLLEKTGPWTQYRKRMLQLRARAWALRDVFPDVLRGIPIAEEVMDYANEREKDVTPALQDQPAEPQKKSDRLKERIKERESAGGMMVTLEEVILAFGKAPDKEKLSEAVDLARGLKRPEEQALANTSYHKARERLGLVEKKPATETVESGGEAEAAAA